MEKDSQEMSLDLETDNPQDSDGLILKRDKHWAKEETLLLIDLWGKYLTELVEVNKAKMPTFEKISEELCEFGYSRSARQVQKKINNLRGEYRKYSQPGSVNPSWPFLLPLRDLLGGDLDYSELVTDDESLTPIILHVHSEEELPALKRIKAESSSVNASSKVPAAKLNKSVIQEKRPTMPIIEKRQVMQTETHQSAQSSVALKQFFIYLSEEVAGFDENTQDEIKKEMLTLVFKYKKYGK
ncbi:hypothetical protein CHUAL_010914 [Chamberlinius hualienensis]